MLCHRYSHASLSFHTVTLRFLGTELIYVTCLSVVYTASCSSSAISIFLRADIPAHLNLPFDIREKCENDSIAFGRLLVNVENKKWH